MTFQRVYRRCVAEARKATISIACWAWIVVPFLIVALTGCGRRQDAAAPTRKPPLQNRPADLAEKTTPRKDQPVRELPSPAPQLSPPQTSLAARATSAVPDQPEIRPLASYELRMEPKDLSALERSAFSNNTYPATFTADGEVYDRVRVRYRGQWARSWPKKPLKIFFTDEKPFQGQRHLNLNSGWHDPAFIRETVAYYVYAVCGVPAPRSRLARLLVNGQFRGLYVEVEQPDKAFVRRLNLKGASVFKASSRANAADERDLGSEATYRAHYEMETQKSEGYRELQRFCQDLARTTNPLDFFGRRVDLEKYVSYLAASTLLQNWDGHNKNHFLVYDGRGTKKWFAVPWDLDRTLGDYWDWSFDKADLPILLGTRQTPSITGWNRMMDRFFSDRTLQSRFENRLDELLDKEFTTEKLFPILDRLEAEIRTDATLDRRRWPGQTGDLHSGIAEVKRFIERRRAYLQSELAKRDRH